MIRGPAGVDRFRLKEAPDAALDGSNAASAGVGLEGVVRGQLQRP